MNGMYVVYRYGEVWTDNFATEEDAEKHIEDCECAGEMGGYQIVYFNEEETRNYWDS